MRGPTGVVGTNKADGTAAAALILKEGPRGKPGREGLEGLLRQRGCRRVGYDEWLRLEEAENGAARAGAPRRKFVAIEDMLAFLDRPA